MQLFNSKRRLEGCSSVYVTSGTNPHAPQGRVNCSKLLLHPPPQRTSRYMEGMVFSEQVKVPRPEEVSNPNLPGSAIYRLCDPRQAIQVCDMGMVSSSEQSGMMKLCT